MRMLRRGDYQVVKNVFVVLFRDDWIESCWDEYADVEIKIGLK